MRSSKQIWIRKIIVAFVFLILAIMVLYYFIFDPINNIGFFPSCTFKASTGLDCVGCGIQRSVHALMHGDILLALDYNPLFVLLLPLLVYYIYFSIQRFIYKKPSPNNFFYSPRFGLMLIIILILFLVLRNIPWSIFYWMNSSI